MSCLLKDESAEPKSEHKMTMSRITCCIPGKVLASATISTVFKLQGDLILF